MRWNANPAWWPTPPTWLQAQLREAEAALACAATTWPPPPAKPRTPPASPPKTWPTRPFDWRTPAPASPNRSSRSRKVSSQQRAALVTAAYALRTDQEDFSAQVESQRPVDRTTVGSRAAAADLGQASQTSVGSMRDLVEAAADQFRALVDMSQREADGFDAATKLALDRFEALAPDPATY